MSKLIILGRSPMVEDLKYALRKHHHMILNRNTLEAPFPEEDKYCHYIACIGSPKSFLTKLEALDKIIIPGEWCTIDLNADTIHYNSNGTLIFPSFVSRTAHFGRHCFIMPNCTINHDSCLGDGTIVASNVAINGYVKIEGNCFIGAGSVIKEHIHICKNVLIGAMSYVNKNITEPGTYYGSPIRKII